MDNRLTILYITIVLVVGLSCFSLGTIITGKIATITITEKVPIVETRTVTIVKTITITKEITTTTTEAPLPKVEISEEVSYPKPHPSNVKVIEGDEYYIVSDGVIEFYVSKIGVLSDNQLRIKLFKVKNIGNTPVVFPIYYGAIKAKLKVNSFAIESSPIIASAGVLMRVYEIMDRLGLKGDVAYGPKMLLSPGEERSIDYDIIFILGNVSISRGKYYEMDLTLTYNPVCRMYTLTVYPSNVYPIVTEYYGEGIVMVHLVVEVA